MPSPRVPATQSFSADFTSWGWWRGWVCGWAKPQVQPRIKPETRWAPQGRGRGSRSWGRGDRGAGEVDDALRQRLVCPGHLRWAPEEASGACGEPDNPLGLRWRMCRQSEAGAPLWGWEWMRKDSKDPRKLGRCQLAPERTNLEDGRLQSWPRGESALCILKALSSGGILTPSLTKISSRALCLNWLFSKAAFPTRSAAHRWLTLKETCPSGDKSHSMPGRDPHNTQVPLGKGWGRGSSDFPPLSLVTLLCLLLLIVGLSTSSKLRLMNSCQGKGQMGLGPGQPPRFSAILSRELASTELFVDDKNHCWALKRSS